MPDKRLLAAASLVRPGRFVCDVGTDHGNLPVYLAENGISSHIIASDINTGPLEAARTNVEAHGVSAVVQTVLSDGLRDIPPETAEDVVVCGMGGELIAQIVLAVEFTRNPQVHLILQPMTQAAYLRKTLLGEGFCLLQEIPVVDRAHRYSVMLWEYDGIARQCDRLFATVGKIPESGLPAGVEYIQCQLTRAEKITSGLLAGERSEEAREWQELTEKLKTLMKERYGCLR